MRCQRPAPRQDSELGLIPMINLVFLLLVFFMIAGRVLTPEHFDIQPPQADRRPASDAAAELMVAADGRLAFAGALVSEEMLIEQLTHREHDQPLTIAVDAQFEATGLVSLLERLYAAGMTEVELRTLARH